MDNIQMFCVCVRVRPLACPYVTGMNERRCDRHYYVNKVSAVDIVINIRTEHKVLVTYKSNRNVNANTNTEDVWRRCANLNQMYALDVIK